MKVVLFDLDGTLHDDPRVTDYYARILEEDMPGGTGRGLRDEVTDVIQGNHPAARPGCFVEPTLGIAINAPHWTAETAVDWVGNPVSLPSDLPPGPIRHDGALRYLGDHWQIIGALAARRGADARSLREAFVRARRFANDPSTTLIRSESLDEVLQRLSQGRRLLLATNTTEELARPLVQRLNMRPTFEVIRFDAHKPAGCAELIAHAKEQWNTAPSEVLVIGDNLWNDLLPPAEQGCRTVHIDPLGMDLSRRWSSARFDNFSAFAAALKEIPDGI
ncbi:HAD family hydrolase [Cryobacterium sp. Y82]|uniref:HAD family hydrolase n=1 Tax=Cryobacterium sp. Y82 TaxID=2045017 RepID=UPI001304E5A2|nr:HAD family hydrolase [Cryobacterium sp. Y82]